MKAIEQYFHYVVSTCNMLVCGYCIQKCWYSHLVSMSCTSFTASLTSSFDSSSLKWQITKYFHYQGLKCLAYHFAIEQNTSLIHAYLLFSLFASSFLWALSFPLDLKYSSLQQNNQVTRKFDHNYFPWFVHCHNHIQNSTANNDGCKIFTWHGKLPRHQWCRNSIHTCTWISQGRTVKILGHGLKSTHWA